MPRPYPAEFRAHAIALVRAGNRDVPRRGQSPPKRLYPVIDRLVDSGAPVDRCCKVLGVAGQNYYKHKRKPTTATQLSRQWLTGLIREIHVASRGTYGYRRFHAAQHRTREGWLYCCAVLDAFSRRIMGWSMDSKADATLVVNALDMAIRNRRPTSGGIVHADHGTQFTSWVFGEKIRFAGLVPSFGSIGDGLDNAMMESFWSSIQIELLDRQKWKTRVELANAIFDYIEIFHNRQRRHSALNYRTPIEYELSFTNDTLTAVSWPPRVEPNRQGRSRCHLFVQQTRTIRLGPLRALLPRECAYGELAAAIDEAAKTDRGS